MIAGSRSLFKWSLRSDSRALYPHIIRVVFSVLILFMVLAAWSASATSTAPVGLVLFTGISYTNVIMICVAGISYFVSAVTEEKDSGNLALLKLAGATPFTIVLSKSVSRQIAAIVLLLVQLPFTQLSVTLGGISPQQVLATYLALVGWLLLVSNFALLCSVICSTTGKAAALATIITLLFLVAGPCFDALLALKGTKWMAPSFVTLIQSLKEHHQLLFVGPRLQSVLASNAQVPLMSNQLSHSLIGGFVCLISSVLLFEKFSEENRRPEHGRTAAVRRILVSRCWKHAILWKDFVFFSGGKTVWLVKLVAYFCVILAFAVYQQLRYPTASFALTPHTASITVISLVLLVSLELLMYASNSLFLEIHHRTASDLLMLPTSSRKIFQQKTAAVFVTISPGIIASSMLLLTHFELIARTGNWWPWIVSWLLITSFLVHTSVLLSLYLRWAALPIAVLVTILISPVLAGAAAGTAGLSSSTFGIQSDSLGPWLVAAFSMCWMWLFILLPIQLEISASWKRCGIKS
ncbi:MAG: hypothetical protein ABJZ55_24800 [Fuerstiella sp.]